MSTFLTASQKRKLDDGKLRGGANLVGSRIQHLDSDGRVCEPFVADGAIVANDFAYPSGKDTTTGYIKLKKAKADAAATCNDLYFCPDAVADTATGHAKRTGTFTSTLTGGGIGNPVYLSAATAGLCTATAPTGTNVIRQVGTFLSTASGASVVAVDLGGEDIPIHDHTTNAQGGAITATGLSGTTGASFTVLSGGSTARLALNTNSATGNYLYSMMVPNLGAATTNTLPTGTAQVFALTANADGSITTTASTGTTNTTFAVDSGGSKPRITVSSDGSGTGNYTLTLKPAATMTGNRTIRFVDADDTVAMVAASQTFTNKTLTTPTITIPVIADFTSATHDHSNAAGGGTLSAASLALQGTTYNSFTVDSDNTTGTLKLQVTTGGTANTITITNTATTADRTITLPDLTGTLAMVGITGQKNYLELDGSTSGGIKIAPIAVGTAVATIVNQAVSASTITLPSATCTLPGLGLANTFSAAQTFSAGIIPSAITGQDSSLGITGMTGSSSAGGDVVIAGGIGNGAGNAGGIITATTGAGIAHTTGTGGASGALTITTGAPGTATTGTAGASGTLTLSTDTGGVASGAAGIGGAGGAIAVTAGTGGAASDGASGNGGAGGDVTITAGTGGASTFATQGAGGAISIDAGAGGTAGAVTIGGTNAESVAIGRITKTTTISGLGIISNTTASDTVSDLLTLTHTSGSAGAAGKGVGVAFQIKDAGGLEEQASIDAVLATATNGAEDADIIFKANLNGDIQQTLKIDSVNQTLVVGQNTTDTDGISKVTIYPLTTASGSLVLSAAVNSGGDYATTITNAASTGAAVTVTLPNATCTLPGLGLANVWTGTADFQAAVTASTGNPTFSWASSSGTFGTSTGTNTLNGNVVVANGKTLKIGSATGGVASAFQIYSPTATNGSIIITCADNAAARDLTITNAALGQATALTIPDPGNATANFVVSKGTQTLTGTYDISGGNVTLPAACVTRAMMAEEALAVYRIPLTSATDATGLHMTSTGGAGLFSVTSGGYGAGTLLLSGEGANGNTKTDTVMFEFALPPEYVAAGDLKVVVKAKYAGAGTVGTKTLDCEAYELDDDGAVGGDICATTIATLTTSYAAYTFNITATDLVAGDKIVVFLQSVIQESISGGALTVTIGNIEVQADIKG